MAIVPDKSENTPTDKSFESPNRESDGNPNGTLTPEYAGEIVMDTTNDVRWKAAGPANDQWYPMDPQVTEAA